MPSFFAFMSTLDAYFRRNYGITQDEYEAQSEFQKDCCATCGGQNPIRSDGTQQRLAVDHDHATDEFRALLCERCNKVLGFVRDSPELLLKMVAYLKEHSRKP